MESTIKMSCPSPVANLLRVFFITKPDRTSVIPSEAEGSLKACVKGFLHFVPT